MKLLKVLLVFVVVMIVIFFFVEIVNLFVIFK